MTQQERSAIADRHERRILPIGRAVGACCSFALPPVPAVPAPIYKVREIQNGTLFGGLR